MKFIDKEEFVKGALDEKLYIFVLHVAALEALLSEMSIYASEKAQIAALKQNEAPTYVLNKYSAFLDIFYKTEALVLLERTDQKEHAIKLKGDK